MKEEQEQEFECDHCNNEVCQWCEKRPAFKDWGICKECERNA